MKKITVVNASPRIDEISNTYKALMAEVKYFKQNNPELEVFYHKLPRNFMGCCACNKCVEYCVFQDYLQCILHDLEQSDALLLGSPVYLDMPTPQAVAFLTRLNCMAENTKRKFFEGKEVYLLSTAYCSGTKSCIKSMMSACEMLGFTIPPRSTREYIQLWKDNKLRGGMSPDDSIFIV